MAAGTITSAIPFNATIKISPTKQEAIAITANNASSQQVLCFDGNTWVNDWTATVGGTGTTRRFDVAYETNYGDVIVVYSANVATTNELTYHTKLGSTG